MAANCAHNICQIHLYPIAPTKAFGREHFSRVPLRTVITLIKTPDPIYVTTALFFREDGTINPTVLVDQESWKEPVPYVHTIHVEDDFERPSISPNFLCHSYRDIVLGPTMNGPPPSLSLGTALSLSGKG